MKIVICLLMFATSSCFAGLLGSSGINPQDNSIHSGPNTGYYGNYGVGRLALKYLATTTPRGYSGSIPPPPIPLFMRLGGGKVIGSGVLSPISVSSSSAPITSGPVQIGSGSYSYSTPKLLRITTRQSNVVDPYRSSSILGGSKILGVLPSTTIPTTYSNLNAFTSPLPYRILRVIQSPSVTPYNFPQPLFTTGTVHRNQYQSQYSSPSPPMTHPQTTTAIFPTMNNPSPHSYMASNYGSDATITSMSSLPPELANAIMKILNEPPTPPTAAASSTTPMEQHSTGHYLPGPAPIVSNSIDSTESGSTNDVQVSKPFNSGSSNYVENRYY